MPDHLLDQHMDSIRNGDKLVVRTHRPDWLTVADLERPYTLRGLVVYAFFMAMRVWKVR